MTAHSFGTLARCSTAHNFFWTRYSSVAATAAAAVAFAASAVALLAALLAATVAAAVATTSIPFVARPTVTRMNENSQSATTMRRPEVTTAHVMTRGTSRGGSLRRRRAQTSAT
jgi:hypothetical protein